MIQKTTNSQAEHKNWKKTAWTDQFFFYYTKLIVRIMSIVRLGYTWQQNVQWKKANKGRVLSDAVLYIPTYYLLIQCSTPSTYILSLYTIHFQPRTGIPCLRNNVMYKITGGIWVWGVSDLLLKRRVVTKLRWWDAMNRARDEAHVTHGTSTTIYKQLFSKKNMTKDLRWWVSLQVSRSHSHRRQWKRRKSQVTSMEAPPQDLKDFKYLLLAS